MDEKYFVFFYKDSMFAKYDSLKKVEKDIERRTYNDGLNRGDICIVKGKELEHITKSATVTIKE